MVCPSSSTSHYLALATRVREGRLHHVTTSIPLCSLYFFLHIWPLVTNHNLPVKFGYRQKQRHVASYYAHSRFQFTSLNLVAAAFGEAFVTPLPWGEQPSLPVATFAEKWWNGGKLELVVDASVPLTIHVCCALFVSAYFY